MADDATPETKKKPRKVPRGGGEVAAGGGAGDDDLSPAELAAASSEPVVTSLRLITPPPPAPPRPMPEHPPDFRRDMEVMWSRIEPEAPVRSGVVATTLTTEVMGRPEPKKARPPSIGSMQPDLGKK